MIGKIQTSRECAGWANKPVAYFGEVCLIISKLGLELLILGAQMQDEISHITQVSIGQHEVVIEDALHYETQVLKSADDVSLVADDLDFQCVQAAALGEFHQTL